MDRRITKVVKATDKLAKASAKGKTATVSTKGKLATAKVEATAIAELNAATLKLGKVIWGAWTKGKLYIALGIREKTATGTGTRAAMLAVAAYGYKQGEGRLLAQAVRAAMGLNPHVGGIDFPWLEKNHNVATITSSATVRLDAKDGKMRLLAVTASTATRKANAATRIAKAKADPQRTNGEVTVTVDKAARKAAKAKETPVERNARRAANRAKQATQGKLAATPEPTDAELATLEAELS